MQSSFMHTLWVGTGWQEPGRIGGGRREGRKWDFKGGGNREKLEKNLQDCAIFCNRNDRKRQELLRNRQEPRVKATGSRRFRPPCPPPPTTLLKG